MTQKILEGLNRKQSIKKLKEIMEENELTPNMSVKQVEQFKYVRSEYNLCYMTHRSVGRRERAKKRWKNSIPR